MSGCGLSFKVPPEKLSNTWPPCGSSGTNPPVTLRVLPSMPADAFSTCKPPDRQPGSNLKGLPMPRRYYTDFGSGTSRSRPSRPRAPVAECRNCEGRTAS